MIAPAMRARLCVASFGEDVSWVAGTGIEACVYDATGQRGEGFIPVKNRAREAGQYLRHIVANYGGFREYEVFLQGNPFDHCSKILTLLESRPWEGMPYFPLGFCRVEFDPNQIGEDRDLVLPFARDIGVGNFQAWTVGAMFAVSRETLTHYSLEWWESLLKMAMIEPRSPWILEQLWPAIFKPTSK